MCMYICIFTVDHRLGIVSAFLNAEAQKILHTQAGILSTRPTSMLIAVCIATDIIEEQTSETYSVHITSF